MEECCEPDQVPRASVKCGRGRIHQPRLIGDVVGARLEAGYVPWTASGRPDGARGDPGSLTTVLGTTPGFPSKAWQGSSRGSLLHHAG